MTGPYLGLESHPYLVLVQNGHLYFFTYEKIHLPVQTDNVQGFQLRPCWVRRKFGCKESFSWTPHKGVGVEVGFEPTSSWSWVHTLTTALRCRSVKIMFNTMPPLRTPKKESNLTSLFLNTLINTHKSWCQLSVTYSQHWLRLRFIEKMRINIQWYGLGKIQIQIKEGD